MKAVPDPEIGQIVLWHPDSDRATKPYAAVVTDIGMDSINVNIMDPFSYNFRIKDGVRHIDDPKAQNPSTRESGAWEHTPETKRQEYLAKRLLSVEAQLTGERVPV